MISTFATRLGLRFWAALLLLVMASATADSQSFAPVIEVANGPNAPAQQKKNYVILVSLDGFRYDYAQKYGARNLLGMAQHGTSAPKGMMPSYPSLTFPNHYSLVTGLYPEHHGIVSNTFYDPARNERYSYTDPKDSSDGSWYGGTPLWVLAEQQGMRSACIFWVASEAEIQGKRPSYYLHYDGTFPNDKRVELVLNWLRLPEDKRPHFITLYYSDVDYAGHKHGPESSEVQVAVTQLDSMIGKLMTGVSSLHLPVDVIVVSDHGEVKARQEVTILDQFADLSHFQAVGSVTTTMLYPDDAQSAQRAFEQLRRANAKIKVYRRAHVPSRLHYDSNPRTGDPVVLATAPFYIRAHHELSPGDPPNQDPGQHGYDPHIIPQMKAIFYAQGPDIRAGVRVSTFNNVDVYPLVAKLLGLQMGPMDGNLKVLGKILQNSVKH